MQGLIVSTMPGNILSIEPLIWFTRNGTLPGKIIILCLCRVAPRSTQGRKLTTSARILSI